MATDDDKTMLFPIVVGTCGVIAIIVMLLVLALIIRRKEKIHSQNIEKHLINKGNYVNNWIVFQPQKLMQIYAQQNLA